MATEMTKTAAQPSVLDLLLGGDIPNVEKELPTAAYKIDRLSDLAGHDVVFKLWSATDCVGSPSFTFTAPFNALGSLG